MFGGSCLRFVFLGLGLESWAKGSGLRVKGLKFRVED
jgi:hypothetical protein